MANGIQQKPKMKKSVLLLTGKVFFSLKEAEMVDVSFEINEKNMEPDDMKDVLDILFLKYVRKRINESVESVCCKIHGKQPSVLVKGQSLDDLSYVVSGCCEEFINKVKKKI